MADPTQDARVLGLKTTLGTNALVIERIAGQESLCRPFEFRVLAVATSDNFSFDDLAGSEAVVKLETGDPDAGEYRYFHGVISQVAHAGFNLQGLSRYELTLVPWIWFLTQTTDCRIFQNLSVPEILEQLFSEANGNYRLELNGTYPARDFCVQYGETDFDFVHRLMEYEGIYYFWVHEEGGHRMVVCDAMGSHHEVSGFEEVIYRANAAGVQDRPVLSSWSLKQRVTPGRYSINSFDFKSPNPSPNSKLLSRSDGNWQHPQGTHEVYENAGDFIDRDEGERYARIRREEVQCVAKTIVTQTNARGLTSGCKFTVAENPRRDQNGEYLVTSVNFVASAGNYGSGSQSGPETYQCSLTGIPTSGVFRPARVTPVPRMRGPQTAIVCGPEGEEIYVDKYGRVKLQFLWDRRGTFDAGSSCWVRVSQAWAGVGFGSMNIPRIGQEVIVDFLDGDPDRPIITGRVYNGSNMPHSSNAGRDGKPGNTPPADLTQAAMMTSFKSNSLGGSGGHNEITMNDKGGSETLFFKAQKDEIHKVGNDREDSVGNNETRKVGVDRSREVGNNETVRIGVNRDKTVGVDETTSVGSNRTEQIGTDESLTVGANRTVTVGANNTESVGANDTKSVGANQTNSIGASQTDSVGMMRQASIGMIDNISAGLIYSVEAGISILLTAGVTVTLKGPGGSIEIGPSGIVIDGKTVTIKGMPVNINP